VILRDAATGKTKWSYKANTSCPLLTTKAVYVANDGEVLALDLKTGKQKAVTDLNALVNHDGEAPVETSTGIHVLLEGDIHTVDKSLKRALWEHDETADLWIDHIAASGTTVIAVTQNGKVKALSSKDGKTLWVYATPSHGQIAEEVSIADGVVYIASKDGSVYALSLATGKMVWATKLGHGEAWSTHLSRKLVITADDELVYGLDKRTGKKKWSHSGEHNLVLATADHAFYSDSVAGEVTVLDATTGTRLTTISDAPGAEWLATSPTHLYVWTDTEIQAHKLTKQATD
jgi:outer membrane protein assembly factor BamB